MIKENNIKIAKAEFYLKLNFNYNHGSNFFSILCENYVVFNTELVMFEDNGFFYAA